ncbi:uncharacterized protein Z518_00176 [Rhinocladiella mackenziei CBS 650.93]|uniref:ATP-dependent DNA helicase n=1 Tax=Rhinocladiella mackenziei CBS 650.93 TaxID=1442369 RepID=A0A0D2HEP7_9EURO|nr:uncharacterized protein Z518_00176 [Rhinocladiella mackenziei CBS 650.93]KIX09098.1 hypothetical protein Z518_00176 [Rhinocladiella mackenziei CBS 650.93]
MDFLDDEADASSADEEVLVPSSQTDDNPRSRKRRRIKQHRGNAFNGDEYDLPPGRKVLGPGGDSDGSDNHRSKYEDHIHIPQCRDQHADTFVTQLTQQWSSPSRIRGPRWVKPRDSVAPPSSQSRAKSPAIQSDQSTKIWPPADDFDDDEDDIALIEAFEAAESARSLNSNPSRMSTNPAHPSTTAPRASLQRSTSFRQTTLHGIHTTQRELPPTQTQSRTHTWPLASRNEPPTHHAINRDAMNTWVYPTNLGRIRDYQYNIVHKGLFHNLLVALPTGLGKTFIAATVMLNWFRWTKDAQIIFVAPTKPLVSQQIDACFNIVGIPRSRTTMLTGGVQPAVRAQEWQEKRVFFMTPQTLINDLKNGMCDPKKVVLVVVDEAHKATGNYAYVEVVRFLRRFNSSFRVLALTATPGAMVESVQEVIDSLGIARVEIRTEDSVDIRDFVHSRNTEIQLFDNSEEISMSLELLSAALQPLMNKLNSQNAYWGKDPEKITLFGLKKASDQWRCSEAGRGAPFSVKGMVQGIFNVLMSMAHNLELLKFHGIGPFYHKMKSFADEASGGGKYAKQVAEDENFKKLMNRLRGCVNNPEFVGHPKLSYLKTVILNHFMDAGEGQGSPTHPSSTRIMVFAHYRDSAEEIVRVLHRHGPLIRAHVFVGQSGTKSSDGMDQKTQLDVMNKFKAGIYNTIVATSIGEEGLDIGEVNLIVCYDCSKSPIRMLQRMGRTGRKRAGNIVLLLMRGKEESDYYQAKDNYQKMQEKIESGKEFQFHEDLSPRIVPRDIVPAVDKREVEIPIENTQAGPLEPKRRKARNAKKPAKKFHMPDGVETGFAFLGNSKKTDGREKKTVNVLEPKTDRDLATLPSLSEVFLTKAEEDQLEERYVRLAGTEDEFIQYVRFDAFPEQQQRLGRTNTVDHSRATRTLVKAFKTMRDSYRDWSRPWEYDEVEELDENRQSDSNAKIVKRRPADASRVLLTSESSNTVGSPGQYDDHDSFIDDGEFDGAQQETDLSDISVSPPQRSPRAEKRYHVTQLSVNEGMNEDSSELGSIMATTGSTKLSPTTDSIPHALKAQRARRVLDSDDDE